MQVAAIMPTKTGVLTLCRGDLRGTARPAWACANWKARRNATRWDGQVYCCQHLDTNAPDEDGRVHSSRDLVCRCCAVLRRLHYRDVDNRRCYISDEILRDIDMYAKSNVRAERPRLPNSVGQERLPQTAGKATC